MGGQEEKIRDYFNHGGDQHGMPPNRAIDDDLDQAHDDLHVAGFFRALAQALDCLAAIVVGVVDVPADIQSAAWVQVNKRLNRLASQVGPRAEAAQGLLQAQVEAGPAGWLTWVVDTRNMLVHRPWLLDVIDRKFGDLDAQPQNEFWESLRSVHHLPKFPRHSLIESFVLRQQSLRAEYLEEDAQVTLEGVMASTLKLVVQSCRILADHWNLRRANPELAVQRNAAKQWKFKSDEEEFAGFAPGSSPLEDGDLVVNHRVGARLIAAGVDDEGRAIIWGDSSQR